MKRKADNIEDKLYESLFASNLLIDEISADEDDTNVPKYLKEYEHEENDENESVEDSGDNEENHPFYDDLFYDSEDSENERFLNTVGDVPSEWYDDYDHIGYDLEGNKIMKIPGVGEDEIDKLLAKEDTPWSVWDENKGRRVLLKTSELEMLRNLQRGVQDERYSAEKWFIPLSEPGAYKMPLSGAPEPKSRFIPSKWEAKRIRKLRHALNMGWISLDKVEKKQEPVFYDIWGDETEENKKKGALEHIPAPKLKLPGHGESYNPPTEYLFDQEELDEWNAMDPEDRPVSFIPKKNKNLRRTPAFKDFQKERFQRCLDLYLATRARVTKRRVDPDAFLPKLPKPSELRPFPSTETLVYEGHEGPVTTIDVDPTGQWLVSGSKDCRVILWEIATARQVTSWDLEEKVSDISWNPVYSLFSVSTPSKVWLIHPRMIATDEETEAATNICSGALHNADFKPKIAAFIQWQIPSDAQKESGILLFINHIIDTVSLAYTTWHPKGDYMASISPKGQSRAIILHQISKKSSQNPFRKNKGLITSVLFHPSKPLFFVASERHIRVYNLVKQEQQKKLQTGVNQRISSIDVHPGGDNLIMSSFDTRVCWFDLELSMKPYKILKYHKAAARKVRYHKKYPLFASCSDDATVHIFHGKVYNDFFQNAFIVPLKILRGHEVENHIGVHDIQFHPNQPWIFSAGEDRTIRLFT
eukprot:TRINITY_DN10254_c0_g1_i1.p1 TRINITY_DN10254_c0_g1~~TRINITY_DN10254_c0_g1_i1.p1  ORF type:complete len:700 (-),score=211.14 TRINITY_DN10254_c0_g1_i1:37-2136(-)